MSTVRKVIRDRLDPVSLDQRTNTLPAGIVAIGVLVMFLIAGFTFHLPFTGGEGGHLVRAEVASANAVTKRTLVRVHGVTVGHVDHVDAGPGGHSAILVMRITNNDVTFHRNAGARVAWRTLLGQMYIDLDPGSPAAPPLGNATIPLSATSTQVDWNDVTSIFGSATRQGERHLIAQLRRALTDPQGQGRTLQALGPDLATVGRGIAPLRGRQPGDLRRLVAHTATTVAALAHDSDALGRLVAGGARTVATTAGHRVALGEAVRLAPAALASTSLTMRRLVPTLDQLDPLVAALRPGARRLGPATRALQPALARTDRVLSHTSPLLSAAPSALRALGAAARQGLPLIDGLRPTVSRTNSDLLPWLDRVDPDTKLRVYEGIGPFISAISSAAGEYDASGHWLHFPNVEGLDSVLALNCDPGLELQDLKRCLAVNQVLGKLLGSKGR